jgi:hypothetical protein
MSVAVEHLDGVRTQVESGCDGRVAQALAGNLRADTGREHELGPEVSEVVHPGLLG